MHARSSLLALALMTGLSTVACNNEPSFDRLTIENVNAPDLGGDLDDRGGEVFEGTLVAASLKAFDTDDEPMELRFETEDSSIIDVRPVSDKVGTWAFIGLHEGSANVSLIANGAPARNLRFVVLPQR